MPYYPPAATPGVTSPVTTDPLTFSGALTFSKNATLTMAGSAAATPRTVLFSTAGVAGESFRVGYYQTDAGYTTNIINGFQGGYAKQSQLFSHNALQLIGNKQGDTPAIAASGGSSDGGVVVLNTNALVKAFIVRDAVAQSASGFEYQDSGGTPRLTLSPTGVGFYGVAAVAQATTFAAVTTTAATNVTPYGFATQAQADALVANVNTIRTVLRNLGLVA